MVQEKICEAIVAVIIIVVESMCFPCSLLITSGRKSVFAWEEVSTPTSLMEGLDDNANVICSHTHKHTVHALIHAWKGRSVFSHGVKSKLKIDPRWLSIFKSGKAELSVLVRHSS